MKHVFTELEAQIEPRDTSMIEVTYGKLIDVLCTTQGHEVSSNCASMVRFFNRFSTTQMSQISDNQKMCWKACWIPEFGTVLIGTLIINKAHRNQPRNSLWSDIQRLCRISQSSGVFWLGAYNKARLFQNSSEFEGIVICIVLIHEEVSGHRFGVI